MSERWPIKPCGECPFTKGGIKLRPARVEELLALVVNDGHFHCHKTLDRPAHLRAGCAGFNILSARIQGGLTMVPRMACATGHLDYKALMAESRKEDCPVYANGDEMRRDHEYST